MTRIILAVLIAISVSSDVALAQSYPERPIRIIVPQGPGGPTDLLARVAGQRLQAALGQSTVVENRPGAGGLIAAKAAASADADGYTLFMGNTSVLVLVPILSRKAAYDPAKLFTPVARLAESYQVLVVHPSLLEIGRGLVACAANPASRTASAGVGTHPSRGRTI
jgi:tripartite-type tricarboxylate transporter receptor subunit TctC